jgi:caffeoyl-CoA O-methyltransferase
MDAEQYVGGLFVEDEALRRIRETSVEAGLPPISIAPVFGRLLGMLAAVGGCRDVLEVGTLGGYSALCIARGLADGGRIVSLERDPRHAEVARRNLDGAGVGERVEIRLGEAAESLAALDAAGDRFDFVFIDADKEGYPRYLEAALRLTRPGALIAADNAIYHGRVADPGDGSDAARAVREFNRTLMTHPRLEAVILPAYDGLALARVRG